MRRLRIGLNARGLSGDSMRGWTRYTLNLVEELRKLPLDITLYFRETPNSAFVDRLAGSNVRFVVSGLRPYAAWEQVWLAGRAAFDRLDVLHCPVHFGLPILAPCRKVLTLHDALAVEERRIAGLVPWFHHAMARCAADRVITVSEYSKGCLQKTFGIPAERISVVQNAAESIFHANPGALLLASVREKWQLCRPFLLYVGGWEKRKNIDFLVRAFRRLDRPAVELLLVGGSPAQRDRLVAMHPQEANLRLLGPVSDQDLNCLYRLARGFVYPSLLEGFGLQVVEAYAAGCPVIGSSTTSLGEVINLAEGTFDPASEEHCTATMAHFINDAGYHDRLKIHAQRSAALFSWRKVAEETFAIYQNVVAQHG